MAPLLQAPVARLEPRDAARAEDYLPRTDALEECWVSMIDVRHWRFCGCAQLSYMLYITHNLRTLASQSLQKTPACDERVGQVHVAVAGLKPVHVFLKT